MALPFVWDWIAFVAGGISTFSIKFLEDYSNYRKQQVKEGFLSNWKLEDWTYVLLGGLFTVAFQPINVYQAIVFGAAWETIVIRLYKDVKEKYKQNE